MDKDRTFTYEEILKIIGETALNMRSNAEQVTDLTKNMEAAAAIIKEIKKEQVIIKEEQDSLRKDFDNFKTTVKENEIIEPTEADQIRQAILTRISDLSREFGFDFDKYVGKFMTRFWCDAKRYSYVVGRGGMYTKKKNFNNVIEYTGTWIPHRFGVMGYIDHLSVLANNLYN